MSSVKKLLLTIIGAILAVAIPVSGALIYKHVSFYRNLDATYTETFPDFSSITSNLKGKGLLLHWKTDFDVDDAQGCVVLNVAYAAVLSGMKPTVLIDASATYLLSNDKLATYSLPERLRKTLALQGDIDLASFPQTYGAFMEYLNQNGVQFVMNGSMNIVSGNRSKVYRFFEQYPYVRPIALMEMLDRIAKADLYIVY